MKNKIVDFVNRAIVVAYCAELLVSAQKIYICIEKNILNLRIMKRLIILFLMFTLCFSPRLFSCTNLLVGSKASVDGSTFLTYNMDSYGMCAKLRITPGSVNSPGQFRRVYDYDNLRPMGEIPQVGKTNHVTGFINEHQLSIVETTWGGRSGQENPDGLIHYTELMQLALERAASAREAIDVMGSLVSEYGYASSGETFSIADKSEIWIMEMIGKGSDEKGAVWIAVRIPDDCVCAHANQSRIHKVNFRDRENVIYASDVVSYARKKGFFKGRDEDFDFSKAYSPTDFHMQRACEARVWSIFNKLSDDFGRYLASVDGMHMDNYEEMPLYIRPNHKISRGEAIEIMRDHYEGTPLDMTVDMTGGPWHSPYRPRPQEYEYDGRTYFHERPIATQQSACVMLCQIRPWMPDFLGGMLWYANDDANMVAYTPLYCCTSQAPRCYNDPEASDVDFSWNSAFWVCNWVSNMVYPRYSIMYPELKALRDSLQSGYEGRCDSLEKEILSELCGETSVSLSDSEFASRLTSFAAECAEDMLENWKKLGVKLVVMYNDMALKPQKDGAFERTEYGRGVAPLRNGYNEMYREAVSKVTGERYIKK